MLAFLGAIFRFIVVNKCQRFSDAYYDPSYTEKSIFSYRENNIYLGYLFTAIIFFLMWLSDYVF
jgi:hypothetical protein